MFSHLPGIKDIPEIKEKQQNLLLEQKIDNSQSYNTSYQLENDNDLDNQEDSKKTASKTSKFTKMAYYMKEKQIFVNLI
jgi:hypothetical protein